MKLIIAWNTKFDLLFIKKLFEKLFNSNNEDWNFIKILKYRFLIKACRKHGKFGLTRGYDWLAFYIYQ